MKFRRSDAKFSIAAVAGIAASLAFFAAASRADDKPPAGLIATSATLDQVLAGYDKARTTEHPGTYFETGRLQLNGLKGTYQIVESGDDYRDSVNLGAIAYAFGSSGGQDWNQNENGIVTLEHNTHQENEISRAALREHSKNNNSGLSLAGESVNPAAYVVEVHAAGGRHEWQYYDKKTFELVKSDTAYPTRRVVTTFDDFRTTDGYTEPWHVHRSDGHPENDEDWVTTSIQHGAVLASDELDIPQSNSNFIQFPAGAESVPLPAKIIDGRVIVTVTINGQGLDFQLDSGASTILMDSGVVTKLGLTKLGKSVETVAGTFEASEAVVPDFAVGTIHMKNVVVNLAPFDYQESGAIKVVGLLGFDFIASAMVGIDYKDGTVEAMPPYLFVPPADAVPLDAVWDDGVPRVNGMIGDVQTSFIIDTGADGIIIFDTFARAHPDVVRDEGGGSMLREAYPFSYGSGVGGQMSMVPTQVKSLTLGVITFQDYIMYKVSRPGFEVEDYAGLIGHKFLSLFTVYLDYRDNHVYLVPTAKELQVKR